MNNQKSYQKPYYFTDKLCTKIEFKNTIELPCNKPKIKCIKDMYFTSHITNTNIVELSMNIDPNDKTLSLTSKRLLIEGYLYIKLLYISCDINKSVCSTEFKTPFHTYIILDDNSNIDLDRYTTKSTIKNICYKLINCKSVYATFDLILLAKKSTPLPPIKKSPNSIIIKSSNNKEVARIDFNATNKVFIVKSTDEIPDRNLGAQEYFIIKLRNVDTQKIIMRTQIIANESANNFVVYLNNLDFSFDDNFIELDYLVPENIAITNYPNIDTIYIPNKEKEFYKITSDGLVAYTPPKPPIPPSVNKLPNIIIVDNKSIPPIIPIVTIEFDKDNQKLLVDSTEFSLVNADSRFSFKLKDSNNQIVKYSSIIIEGSDVKNFVNDLNNKQFQYGDILEIDFTSSISLTITNFPTEGKIYSSDSNKEYFRITPNGLVAYTPTPPPVRKLPNKITINSNLGNEVATIEFDADNNKFIIISTGEIPNSSARNTPYFSLKLKSISTQQIKQQEVIKSNENANTFANNLNNHDFQYTDFLELEYSIPPSVRIANYPEKDNIHIPSNAKEYFAITPQGLKPYTPPAPPVPPPTPINKLANTIIVDNRTSSTQLPITTIQFDSDNKKFIITPTDTLMNTNGTFSLKLKDTNNQIIKYSSTILSNSTSRSFANNLNNKTFEYGDILEIDFSPSVAITASNFPDLGQTYRPTTTKEFFRITPTGLTTYIPPTPPVPPTPPTLPTINKLPNTIIVDNRTTSIQLPITTIQFDSDNKKFIITPTDTLMNTNGTFSLKLKDTNNQIIKYSSTILSNSTSRSFANNLNNKTFEYGDILEIDFSPSVAITVSNFPDLEQTYRPTTTKEFFRITPTGLTTYIPPTPPVPPTPPTGLINKIIIVNDDGDEISTLEFDISNKKIKVTATNVIPDVTQGTNPYFTFKLKDKATNREKINNSIPSNTTANNFRNALNNFSFEFTDFLELDYFEPANILITDYPNKGNDYTPNNDKEYFSITPNGLVAYTPISPPTPPPPPTVINSKIKLYIRNNSTPSTLEEVASIELNKSTNKFVVTAPSKIINLGLTEYFNITQLSSSGNILNDISINRSDNINKLGTNLNDRAFTSGNIVSLRYVNRDLIKVENIKPNTAYTLKDSKDLFKIENGALTPFSSTALSNIVTFLSEDDTRVGTISFYTNPKILTVFFTLERTSSTFPNDNYFTVKLKDSNNTVKFQESIKGKENFNKIAIALDNKSFEFNDILELSYKQTSKITISNFGSQGATFTAPGNSSSYIITPAGLQLLPSTLKNTITLNGANNEQISTISFNTDSSTLLVTSSGKTAYTSVGGNQYFAVELIDPLSTTKIISSIKGNENADKFKTALNNYQFEFGYIISLEYTKKDKVSISNYPNDSDNYTPIKNTEENFIITPNGLVKANILPNVILVKNTDNSNLFYVLFDTANKKLIVKNTGSSTNPSGPIKIPYYISIEVKGSNGLLKHYGYLKPSGSNSSIMTTALDGKPFEFGDFINLTYLDEKKVFITNMATSSPNPQAFGQSFVITERGLQNNPSELTNNTIIVKGDTNTEIVDVKFTMPGPKLDLTGKNGKVPAKFFGQEYFKLSINRFNTNINTESTLIFSNASDTPDDFIDPLQNEDVYFESLITLNYKESNRVQVTNVTIPTSFVTPRSFTESFRVTLDGLKLVDNVIKFLDSTNTTVAMLTFDHTQKRVVIWGENKIINNNSTFSEQDYFTIEVKSTNGTIKSTSSAKGKDFASKLEANLNYTIFEYGDILTLKYKENNKISISNYPVRGSYVYNPETTNTEESFKITAVGLIPLKNIIRNIIIVLDGNNILATIMFDKDTKKLIAHSTGKTASSKTPTNYFKLILRNGSTVVAQSNLLANENANKFKVDLNDKDFDTGYIIELTAIPNTLLVANYTNINDRFTTASPLKTMFLQITAQALVPYNPPSVFLDNVINFRSANNSSDAATIKFDTATNRLNVTADGSSVERTDKFDFTLKDSANNEKIKASINNGENGTTFASTLTDVSFNIGDKIEIGTVDKSRALITNLPIEPNEYFLPRATETFTIASDGFKFATTSPLASAEVLPQIITIQGKINTTVTDILATVYIDKKAKKLIVYSTGKTVVSSQTGEYFALVIKDSSDTQLKEAVININQNADNFATDLNGFVFEDNYVITIRINQNA